MANSPRVQDMTDSASKYLTASLDNLQRFIGRASDEVAKADVVGANRRIADQVIDGAKQTVQRMADSAAKNEPVVAVLQLASGTLESAQQAVRVAGEESQRINLVETGSNLTQEGLELMRRQLELAIDASRDMGSQLSQWMPVRWGARAAGSEAKRPGTVTRVEIETDAPKGQPETLHAK